MRGVVAAVVWVPVLGASALVFGLWVAWVGWFVQDLVMRYTGGAIAGSGLIVALGAPISSLTVLALAWWSGSGGWTARLVALVPFLGPIAVWHWTLSKLWVPPPLESRAKRRKEEVVTAEPGWLSDEIDTGPTPIPLPVVAWDPTGAATISDRLPQVRALWELEPDRVATEEVGRPVGRLQKVRGAVRA